MSQNESETPMRAFDTIEEAYAWMLAEVDDPCVDNYREAVADDPEAVAKYEEMRRDGCCGAFDAVVLIKGQKYMIGCHYGH